MVPDHPPVPGVSHFEITVRELDRSLAFYRDLLGLHVLLQGTSDQAFPGAGRLRIYEAAPRDFRFALLHPAGRPEPYGTDARPSIMLLCPLGAPPTGNAVKVDQIGITHFGLWVSGLDDLYEDLEGAGVRCLEPPHDFMVLPHGVVRSAFVEDPDGVIVQLDELLRR